MADGWGKGRMLTYSDLVIWSKNYDLVLDRIKIVNQLHGCSYADSVWSRSCSGLLAV